MKVLQMRYKEKTCSHVCTINRHSLSSLNSNRAISTGSSALWMRGDQVNKHRKPDYTRPGVLMRGLAQTLGQHGYHSSQSCHTFPWHTLHSHIVRLRPRPHPQQLTHTSWVFYKCVSLLWDYYWSLLYHLEVGDHL